jgi:hypothetical protein
MILTLVGISYGTLDETARRARGVGGGCCSPTTCDHCDQSQFFSHESRFAAVLHEATTCHIRYRHHDGAMSLSAIASEIQQVFDVDPMRLEIMRIDLAVDVPTYSVQWFRQHARVSQARYTRQFERTVFERKNVETLYFGQRPHIIRIYNKCALRRVEFNRLVRHRTTGDTIPTFEERYGHSHDDIITRVEHQYGVGRVPKTIGTIGRLRENAVEFNPFAKLEFSPIAISEDSLNKISGNFFLKAQGFIRLVERHGFHEAKRTLDTKSHRNTSRFLTELARVIGTDETSEAPDLFSIYKEAIRI